MANNDDITTTELMNQTIRELWELKEYGASMCGVIFYPIMWAVIWYMKTFRW